MKETLQRIQGQARRKVSERFALPVIATTVALCTFSVGNNWRLYRESKGCRWHRYLIAKAEHEYWQTNHRFLFGDQATLRTLFRATPMPSCKQGGHYTAVLRTDGGVEISCSLPAHGPGVWRPKPLLDSNLE